MCLASHAFEQVVQQPQHAFHVTQCNHITLSVGGEVQCRPCEFDRGFDTAGGTLYRYSQKVKLRNWRPLQIERKPQLTTIYARDDSGARCALSKISERDSVVFVQVLAQHSVQCLGFSSRNASFVVGE